MKKRFVILDRDGTLIVEKNYLSNPEHIQLIPSTIEALKKLREMGLGLVVITNQAGISRGYYDLKTLEQIHNRLTEILSQKGVFLDDIYFCPHTPEDNCLCRKPKIGLIQKAAKEHDFDLKECFVIGDKAIDIELGQKMGAQTFLVRTGYGAEVEKQNLVKPDYIADDLYSAVKIIKSKLR